jgi:hypothetical protein
MNANMVALFGYILVSATELAFYRLEVCFTQFDV